MKKVLMMMLLLSNITTQAECDTAPTLPNPNLTPGKANPKLTKELICASDFRTGEYRIMISTNITARGIDIQQVSVVINFDIPKDIHTYIHRIGRSGRWGRKGVGINFITRRDIIKRASIIR